jgi:hypothetical protein
MKRNHKKAPTVTLKTVREWMLYTRWCDEYRPYEEDDTVPNMYIDQSRIGMVCKELAKPIEYAVESRTIVLDVKKLQSLLQFAADIGCECVGVKIQEGLPLEMEFGRTEGLFAGFKGYLAPRVEEEES